jgi:hypothetical protein
VNPTARHDDELLSRSRRTIEAARQLTVAAEPRQILLMMTELKGQLAQLQRSLARVEADSEATTRRCRANSAYRSSYALKSR